jgi:hypothetical protein
LQATDLLGQKEGVRGLDAVLVPDGIFNRYTAVYLACVPFASGKVATTIRAEFLLARLSPYVSPASLAAKRLKSIGNGAASSTFAFGFGRLA